MKKIGVVGSGLVGSIFKGLDEYEVVHRNEWSDRVLDWRGIVNCCAIAGQRPCDDVHFAQVNRANVLLPLEMAYCGLNFKIPFITFSTMAVYNRPVTNRSLNESAPLYSQNAYAASKIVMEAVLPDTAFIFLIPMVINRGWYTGRFWRESEPVESCRGCRD